MRYISRDVLVLAALLLAAVSPAGAASFYLTPDVPTDLGSTTFLPWQVVRNDSGAYSAALAFPSGTVIDALHRMDGGHWLFSVEAPVQLGPAFYDPRDVIRYDGLSYSLVLDGAASGVPAGSNLDALFLDGEDAGDLVVSFDVPTTIGSMTYEPADLARFAMGAFSLYFDASAANPPVPSSSNVTGAGRHGALTILTFDVPTTLGGTTFLAGELVSWNGTVFASFYLDTSWPAGSRADALAFLAGPGVVPRMDVEISSITPGGLTISWSASCSAGAEGYAIYEGTIGNWYSHAPIDCSDDGPALTEEVIPSPGDRYYLVVPLHANDEGSYGTSSSGAQIPAGSSACVASQAVSACP